MKKEEIIRIGNNVEIDIYNKTDDKLYTYLSKIEDIDEKENLYIGIPIDKGKMITVSKGEDIIINCVKKDGVYNFTEPVIGRVAKPFPYFIIKTPKKINRIQRRNYVRILVNLLVDFFILNEDHTEGKGVSINLSGGGIKLMLLKPIDIESNLEVSFTLTNGIRCKNIIGEIVREDIEENENGKRYYYSIEFLEVEDKMRDDIISYLFDIQRERMKKGLDI